MTKYIVQSGGMKRVPKFGRQNFIECFKDFEQENISVLWCFFAQRELNDTTKALESYQFLLDMIPVDQQFKHTVGTIDQFEKQVAETDVVYLHGGYPELFLERTKKLNLAQLFQNKTVCTNSATTLALSQAGWDSDSRECVDGLGILPCKTLVHYKSPVYGFDDPRGPIDWTKAYQELEAYDDTSLPIHALEEGDFVVYEM